MPRDSSCRNIKSSFSSGIGWGCFPAETSEGMKGKLFLEASLHKPRQFQSPRQQQEPLWQRTGKWAHRRVWKPCHHYLEHKLPGSGDVEEKGLKMKIQNGKERVKTDLFLNLPLSLCYGKCRALGASLQKILELIRFLLFNFVGG